jgi:opacity protein-like surface antigen
LRASPIVSFAAAVLLSLTATSRTFAQGGDASTPVPGQAAAAAVPAHAGVSGLDVMTATVFQEGQSSFSGLALRLRLKSGALVPNVEILPAVEYWQNKSSVSVLGGIRTTRSDATLGCSARWTFTRDHWQPYIGAGLAVHFLDDKVHAPQLGVNNQHNSTVRGGYSLHGGVSFTLTKSLSNFVELEHHGVSNFRQLKFNTGLGWNF